MDQQLDEAFWSDRYREGNTGWDIGYPSPALMQYMEKVKDKEISILLPGAGNAYEAAALHAAGFKNIYVLDLSALPLQKFRERNPGFPESHILQGNFFDLDLRFDLVMEQTFFCAIDPVLRPAYAKKMHEILNPGGILFGLLFASPFQRPGPPFGGTKKEYMEYFTPYFGVINMEICQDSIPPRAGNELFFECRRRN